MIDVMLFEDESTKQWICRGLNIDYCAYGATVDEARLNFWHGLAQTFWINQKRFGTVERVMKEPPPAQQQTGNSND